MTPDATCNYVYAGEFNGRAYLRRLDGAYSIWWGGVNLWYISAVLGELDNVWWERESPNIEGDYVNHGSATGIATVTAGEH